MRAWVSVAVAILVGTCVSCDGHKGNHHQETTQTSTGTKHHSGGPKHQSTSAENPSTSTENPSSSTDQESTTTHHHHHHHHPAVEARALKPHNKKSPRNDSLSLDIGSDRLIRHINTVQSSWKAGRNFNLNTSSAYISTLMGVLPDAHTHRAPELRLDPNLARARLPPFFDARSRWPRCLTIPEIHDQGSCGSCWAIAAVACINDRICIHNNGNPGPRLSAQDMLSCCTYCGFGCKGGFPDRAWQYYCKDGLPTGGWYGTREGCKPYALPPCRHTDQGFGVACPGLVPTPACTKGCEAGVLTNRYYGRQYYSVRADQKYIMHEILNNGPVEASFEVYEDLLVYKSGVYHHVSGKLLGGHSVRLLGWGKEHDMEYWIAVNSWNTQWGERGIFKIRRGTDECGIEKFVIAGLPRT